MRLLEFWTTREFLDAVIRHIMLVIISVSAAIAVGIPAGVFAYRKPSIGRTLTGFTNIVQTIPSLALFGFLIPIPFIGGIGIRAALIVLILYALLPIIQTTLSGLKNVAPGLREAGAALGMTESQVLLWVELPLARTSILAGIRVATVICVGTAAIAAAIGAGGLGEYIFRGVASVDSTIILAGAIPAAILALIADFSLNQIEKASTPGHKTRFALSFLSRIAIAAIAVIVLSSYLFFSLNKESKIVVGSKNFTEQIILGEIIAQLIETKTDLKVERKFNLGDTLVCETALRSGDLDIYTEYTGTAFASIFKHALVENGRRLSSDKVSVKVADDYASSGRTMLDPLGFNNTFVILVRGEDAHNLKLKNISDIKPYLSNWIGGFGNAFLDREDGYRGLVKAYDLQFSRPPLAMDVSLTYRALADKQVDVISGDATNGLIAKLNLVALEDDKHYFPPYVAVPVIRIEVLNQYPQLRSLIDKLSITDDDMRRMNADVDVNGRNVKDVAKQFLKEKF